MPRTYPLSHSDQRSYPEGFEGRVFVWDIDKTYLQTHFSSMKGMARVPVEFAIDKRAVPGMPEILRGLRHGPGPEYACAPLYFVSASPPQLRKVIERKMLLDGVEHDGITFKDWFKTLRMLRPGRLREQAGFKINALLTGRLARPQSREYLFGDDVEVDAQAFHLYSRLLDPDMTRRAADSALQSAGVKPDDRRCVHRLLERMGDRRGSVEKIFIHLSRGTPPERFARFGELVVPVQGAFQLALALYHLGLIGSWTVAQVGEAVFADPSAVPRDEMITDAVRRKMISDKALRELELSR